jgi:hypothetical protein
MDWSLFIVCVSSRHIGGPVDWSDSCLRLVEEVANGESMAVLSDDGSGFRLACSSVTMAAMKPSELSLE